MRGLVLLRPVAAQAGKDGPAVSQVDLVLEVQAGLRGFPARAAVQCGVAVDHHRLAIVVAAEVQRRGIGAEVLRVIVHAVGIEAQQHFVFSAQQLAVPLHPGVGCQALGVFLPVAVLAAQHTRGGCCGNGSCTRLCLQIVPAHLGLEEAQAVVQACAGVQRVVQLIAQREHLTLHLVVVGLANEVATADGVGAVAHTLNQLVGQGGREARVGLLVERQQGERGVRAGPPGEGGRYVQLVVRNVAIRGIAVAPEHGQPVVQRFAAGHGAREVCRQLAAVVVAQLQAQLSDGL